jgi:hypothetical protein
MTLEMAKLQMMHSFQKLINHAFHHLVVTSHLVKEFDLKPFLVVSIYLDSTLLRYQVNLVAHLL